MRRQDCQQEMQYHLRNEDLSKVIEEIYELFPILNEKKSQKVGELSGGQRQRVALARALITNPKILLLDEPLSALDANLRIRLREELRKIHRLIGTTFICVTHDQEEAMALSDRIAILKDGQIEQIGTPNELYDKPTSEFVANFFGKCALWPINKSKKETENTLRV